MPDRLGDPALLGSGNEVIHEHPESRARSGLPFADDGRQIVDAAEVLDDDALGPQIAAPDLLDQFGVVAPLDENAAGARHARAARGIRVLGLDDARAGGRACGAPGRRTRRIEHDGRAVDQVPAAEREPAHSARAVLERDPALLESDDCADPSAGVDLGGEFHDEAALDGHAGHADLPPAAPVPREHVGAVGIELSH